MSAKIKLTNWAIRQISTIESRLEELREALQNSLPKPPLSEAEKVWYAEITATMAKNPYAQLLEKNPSFPTKF